MKKMEVYRKLQDLRDSYLKKMPEKILMSKEVATDPSKDDMQWEEFYDLPEVYQGGDDWSAIVLKVFEYKNGKMYCIDPSDNEVYEYDPVQEKWLFPLEILAEINELH